MKKTVMTALAVLAGVGIQAQAQVSWPSAEHITTITNYNGNASTVATPATTKLGLLNFSLKNVYQAYQSGSTWGVAAKPNDIRVYSGTVSWDNISYTYSDGMACQGAITYKSASKTIDNKAIIAAINKALSWPVGKNTAMATDRTSLGGPLVASGSIINPNPYRGQFTTTAKIVAVNYDNGRYLPPYPPTEDYVGDEGWGPAVFDPAVWNAPWYMDNLPDTFSTDGTTIGLHWPNQNYISWGKPWVGATTTWAGARVFIIDTKNANVNLRCFDVTPFFALEESYCYYCWDTMDRVTDGKVSFGTSSSQPPCAGGTSSCGVSGNGTTRFYWTVKFNNVMVGWNESTAPNHILSGGYQGFSLYYNTISGFDPSWGDTYGWKLDDTDYVNSIYAMSFAVSGQAAYSWKFKALSDGASWPMGTYSMNSSGHGFSPMCGLFSGAVSMTEYDKTDKQFGGVWCVTP